MTLILLLGVSSGLCWGAADFLGGLEARRLPAIAVTLWSQIVGAAALAAVLLLIGAPPNVDSVVWGGAAGVFGGLALVSFYQSMATGAMSLVAPVSACGALVPVVFAFLAGNAPDPAASVGIVLALAGLVLISLHSEATPQHARLSHGSLALALGAALGFGFFYVCLDRASSPPGATVLWAVAGTRAGSLLTVLLLAVLVRQKPPLPRRLLPIVLVGLLDTSANVLFASASTSGNPGIVAVLGSLYPVVPVLMGRLVLAERLTLAKYAGVALALLGVALISIGVNVGRD